MSVSAQLLVIVVCVSDAYFDVRRWPKTPWGGAERWLKIVSQLHMCLQMHMCEAASEQFCREKRDRLRGENVEQAYQKLIECGMCGLFSTKNTHAIKAHNAFDDRLRSGNLWEVGDAAWDNYDTAWGGDFYKTWHVDTILSLPEGRAGRIERLLEVGLLGPTDYLESEDAMWRQLMGVWF